jgi:hypothetical protein
MRNFVMVAVLAASLGACAPAGPVQVGQAAPLFSLPSVAGSDVALEDFRGRPVLLYFHMAVG